jgi:hypothetical protein
VVSLLSRYKDDTIRSHTYAKNKDKTTWKLGIKGVFLELRLIKQYNESISLVEIGVKRSLFNRESSQLASWVYQFSSIWLIISYVCMIWMSLPLFMLYECIVCMISLYEKIEYA